MRVLRLVMAVLPAVATVTVVTGSSCFADNPTAAEIETKFSRLLRNSKVSSIKESPVKGMYEVVSGPNVFYYSPAGNGHLIFGQILDSNGKNLTADVQNALRAEFQKAQEAAAAEKLKALDLSNAVKIGNGPNTVIEFTDPDCPFCRRVDEFLSSRSDVTRYVFLFPLEQLHPQARAKSIYILSSTDKVKAFKEVFSGTFDKGNLPIVPSDLTKYPSEVKQLETGMQAGQQLGVQGTPLLFVNGSMVNGANVDLIKTLLTKQ